MVRISIDGNFLVIQKVYGLNAFRLLLSAEQLTQYRAGTLSPVSLMTQLNGASVEGPTKRGLSLERADLKFTDLTYADLTGANLMYADLIGATLTGATLTNADLTNADLTRAALTYADLTGANLTRAYLTRATLTGAILTDAMLTGADLTGAILIHADLSGATISGIRTDNTGTWEHVPIIDGPVALKYITAVQGLTDEQLAAAREQEPEHAFSRAILNVLMPDQDARNKFLQHAGNSMTALCLIVAKEGKMDKVPNFGYLDGCKPGLVGQEALNDPSLKSVLHVVTPLQETIAELQAEIAKLKAQVAAAPADLSDQFGAAAATTTVAPAAAAVQPAASTPTRKP